jgi:hypothetical protein
MKCIYLCVAFEERHLNVSNGPFVYRLGRQVFILVGGVRFPYGLQKSESSIHFGDSFFY